MAPVDRGASTVVFPPMDAAPKVEGQPQGCLWGFYDGDDGKKDEVGALNLLTPAVVKEASREIQTGEHVQLDWELDSLEFPPPFRRRLGHKVIDLSAVVGLTGFDDEVHFNTQSGSQWDSLKHFAHQQTRKYYNGLTHEEALKSDTNGIHNWCERGGIVGRGILVDWVRWYESSKGPVPPPRSGYGITVAEIEAVLESQGTTVRQGDILFVRTGFIRWHNTATSDQRSGKTDTITPSDAHRVLGVQGGEAAVRWLYDRHFAAVVADNFAFEQLPFDKQGWMLHEWLLVQWGTPIGEMWDLEGLAAACERHGRWSFFVTSAPLNVKGGVGSPPCAIAIF